MFSKFCCAGSNDSLWNCDATSTRADQQEELSVLCCAREVTPRESRIDVVAPCAPARLVEFNKVCLE
jgi:hypothetical protein